MPENVGGRWHYEDTGNHWEEFVEMSTSSGMSITDATIGTARFAGLGVPCCQAARDVRMAAA
jgi:hypothetical protein